MCIMNEKAKKFDAFLEERNLQWFTKEEMTDEFNSVVYRGFLEAASQRFPLFIVLDDTVFTMARMIAVSADVPAERRGQVAEYLSELNGKFKIFKYYIAEDGGVYMDISIPSLVEEFNPELVLYLIGQILLPHVEEYYPQLMEKVWGRKEEEGTVN